MSIANPHSTSVIISNGSEFFEIDSVDLEQARADGFYLPSERGLTVISNGSEVFEVTLEDSEAAKGEGFRDLVADLQSRLAAVSDQSESPGRKRKRRKRNLLAGLPALPVVNAGAVAIQTGQDEKPFDVGSVALQTADGEDAVITEAVSIDCGSDGPQPAITSSAPVTVSDVVDEEVERRLKLEEELEEAEGFDRVKLWLLLQSPSRQQIQKFCRSYGVSVMLHALVLLGMSLILLQAEDPQDGGAIISSVVSTDDASDEEFEEVDQAVEMEDTEMSEAAEASDLAGEIIDNLGLEASSLLSSFDASQIGGGAEGLSEALGKGIEEMTGAGKKANASFFGSKQTASRFVFVIDNSNSMTQGRFETALNELAKTVMRLTPEQSFYVIFYSDTAYGLFHPQTYDDLVPATPRNKQLTLQWLTTVQLCLLTNGAEAMQMAFALSPDVIFVLGDGAFTDNGRVVSVMNAFSAQSKKITVHTLGMQVDQNAASKLQFLSKFSGGTYHNVDVHPQAAIMAQQTPRKRNNTRGPVWGITLKN